MFKRIGFLNMLRERSGYISRSSDQVARRRKNFLVVALRNHDENVVPRFVRGIHTLPLLLKLLRIFMITSIVVLLWQIAIMLWQLPNYLLPTPFSVMQSLIQQWHLIFVQALPTFFETLLGLLGGILFGCCMALLITYCRFIATWFLPLVIVSQIIPTFAIAPLFVIWLGYGLTSKVAMAILMVFFPVTSAFYDGLSKTPTSWLQLAKTMQASAWHTFWRIRFPAALPALASGIRIAAVAAPMGAIVGEWVGASRGLGYLMLNANARLQIDMMFASLIVLILFALLLYYFIDQLLRQFIWWT